MEYGGFINHGGQTIFANISGAPFCGSPAEIVYFTQFEELDDSIASTSVSVLNFGSVDDIITCVTAVIDASTHVYTISISRQPVPAGGTVTFTGQGLVWWMAFESNRGLTPPWAFAISSITTTH